MAFDDLTALGAIRALTKAGVKVPENCSVVGFDDVPLSSLSAPSLTTCGSRSKPWATWQ